MLILAAAAEELGDLPGLIVGVGPVIAAARASAIIAEHKPDAILLIGTAGSYVGGPEIGQVISSRTVGLRSGVSAMGLGYTPRPPAPIEGSPTLMAKLDIEHHNVLTVPAVTTDETLALRLSDGYTVEHLEAFGVAAAAREVGIPFLAVLCITNIVGPNAHTQWLANRDSAQAAARAAIAPLIKVNLP